MPPMPPKASPVPSRRSPWSAPVRLRSPPPGGCRPAWPLFLFLLLLSVLLSFAIGDLRVDATRARRRSGVARRVSRCWVIPALAARVAFLLAGHAHAALV